MTTIAYKDGYIACDSRVTKDNLIVDDDYSKLLTRNGITFFITGATADYETLVDAYITGKYSGSSDDVDACAIVVDKGKLYTCAIHNKELWKAPERFGNPIAIGSGGNFAIAFMDSGMSAEDAVKATCKRDAFSGGAINVYSVESLSDV